MDPKRKNKLKRKMRQFKKINFVRRIVQFVCFLLLPGFFIQIYSSTKALVMALLAGSFSLQANSFDLVVVLSVYPLTLLFGRFFCGWICAMGSLEDLLTSIRNGLKIKAHQIGESTDSKLKLFKYILLLFSILFVWVLQIVAIPQGLNPLDAFGILVSLENLDLLFTTFLIATVLLIGILVASFFVPRFFCRYLCPTGAILSLISLPRMLTIKKPRENCRNCSLCTQNCPMSIPLYITDKSRSGECIECGQCVTGCPMKNCNMQFLGMELNSKTLGAVAATSIVGLNYLGTITVSAMDFESAQATTTIAEATTQPSTVASTGQYQDGTYEGSARGFKGLVTVSVTVENGLITDIEDVSNTDTHSFFERCWSVVTDDIIEAQNTDVDAVTGATYSSVGIMDAVADALSGQTATASTTSESIEADTSQQESAAASSEESASSSVAAGQYADGVYTGSGTGFRGETVVEVTVQNGLITDITETSKQDDDQFFYRAWTTVIEEIITAQAVEVDAVSGATFSSNSIMEAVSDALGLAFENPNSSLSSGHGGH
ncbi:FMN-binding protein [Trichococcus collinsii]|uniref:4Fe-4S binding domain-containing protein n=1 Tax=Trichococcus collinsii TaxID=157076 RepID=A0AB38A2I7_9LACT|nr:FMN-binding protein [Trichococcus collinsii]CZQ98865.1 Hypothetical protein Tcol_1665 [Trichococcus collinsii]SEA79463.1 4Fe-4S binding domain-containing protein [Trichococcus collinsii]